MLRQISLGTIRVFPDSIHLTTDCSYNDVDSRLSWIDVTNQMFTYVRAKPQQTTLTTQTDAHMCRLQHWFQIQFDDLHRFHQSNVHLASSLSPKITTNNGKNSIDLCQCQFQVN